MNIIKYTSATIAFCLLLGSPLNAQISLGKVLDKAEKVLNGENPLSQDDIGEGLKEALNKGVGEAVDKLSAENGYLASAYKIQIPEEAQKVITKLKLVPGFEDVEEQLIQKMNKAAELAAKKATPIFVDAITSISFDDAMNILTGNDDAATLYLQGKSQKQLYNAFMPVISNALDEVNARTYWRSAVNAYNKIPFIKKVNPELDDHVNTKALEGLFALIAVKEEGIRNNIDQRNTDLLKKVFAKQD